MLHWIGWFLIRVGCTLTCVYTVWHVVLRSGYNIPFTTMLAASVAIIVGVRLWMPSQS